MSNLDDYTAQLAVMNALETAEVKTPNMPVDAFVQEGENLLHWCQQDKDALTKVGLDWTLVESLPVNLGALREA